MRLDLVKIDNFRGIESLELRLEPQFNLLIGENGAGKTAVLSALAVGASAYLTALGLPTRHIRLEDLRYVKTVEGSFEYAMRTAVNVLAGRVNERTLDWGKYRLGPRRRTSLGRNSAIKHMGSRIMEQVLRTDRIFSIDLPVIAFYPTSRLWKIGAEPNLEADDLESPHSDLPSRFRAYADCLDIKSTVNKLLEWFESKFQAMVVEGQASPALECVRSVVVGVVPGVSNVKWVFDRDKIRTLYVVFEDGSEVPFSHLSDGYRNLLAMFADLAWRCVTLNPHHGQEAHLRTDGLVLIDELDLHLHPTWQKDVVRLLKSTFPKIQFVASSHSPFIIQEMDDHEVIQLDASGERATKVEGTNRMGLEDIAEEVQGVDSPQMSKGRQEMFEAAERYYSLLDQASMAIDNGGLQSLKDELDAIVEKYSDDVAYTAFLKQERLARGIDR